MQRSRGELKQDIVEHLLWDSRIEAADIDVTVDEDLTVQLSGTAPSPLVKQAAAEDAFAIPGVALVINRIDVKVPGAGMVHKGRELRAALETVFTLHPGLEHVRVLVEDGRVQLSGSVDSLWKKLRAAEIAGITSGTEEVDNDLVVVPTSSPHDEEVAERILAALRRTGKVDPREITVQVRGGAVTLAGTVENWEQLSAAYAAAKYTEGVISIDDQLQVTRSRAEA